MGYNSDSNEDNKLLVPKCDLEADRISERNKDKLVLPNCEFTDKISCSSEDNKVPLPTCELEAGRISDNNEGYKLLVPKCELEADGINDSNEDNKLLLPTCGLEVGRISDSNEGYKPLVPKCELEADRINDSYEDNKLLLSTCGLEVGRISDSNEGYKPLVPKCELEADRYFNDGNGDNKLLLPTCGLEADRKFEGPVAKKTKMFLDWNLIQKFDNCDQAEKAVKSEDIWSVHYRHETEDGKKTYYRCNKLKKRGPQCAARMYLLSENTSDCVLMFKTNADHDHDKKSKCASSYGLSDTVKTEINKLLDLKLKPKAIMHCLTNMDNIKVPKMYQVKNYLSERRRTMCTAMGEPTISLKELEGWLHVHSDLPLDPHQAFVIGYEIDDSNENSFFRFILSTKHLMEISKNSSVVHVDSTYRNVWQRFPVLVCGTTDQDRKFHPLGLVVSSHDDKDDFKLMFKGFQNKIQEIFGSSWNPKVLVCDDAKSIKYAFLEVFGKDLVIRICWGHAKKKIQERIERIQNVALRSDILNDIETLHSVTDKNIFDVASEAFLQKYVDQPDFVTYFETQWLMQNRNWFLGAAAYSPSTNSALESFNRVIRNSNTIREYFPLSRFLVVAKEMVSQWSNKYITHPEENLFAKLPSLTVKDWIEAYQWSNIPKEMTVVQKDDSYNYYKIPAGDAIKCEILDAHWDNFNDFKKKHFSTWLVTMPIEKNEWRKGRCNCPAFFNVYKCKHVIGLAIRFNYTIPPLEVKNIPIGEKRKRGRPSKAK